MHASPQDLTKTHNARTGLGPLCFVCVIIVCVFAIYSGTLRRGFILDDGAMTLDSPWVQSFDIVNIFTHGYYASSKEMNEPDVYYRPLISLSLALDYKLYGQNPWGYHLTNILLHMANCMLMYFIGRRLFKNTAWLYLWILLFLSHPIHDQPVCLITGRCDTLPAFLILLGIYLWMHKKAYAWITGACLITSAVFAKEIAVFFYAWLSCYFAIKRKFRSAKVIVLFCALACVSAIRIFFVPEWVGLARCPINHSINVSHILQIAYSLGFQLWLLFVPTAICLHYPWPFPTYMIIESTIALACFFGALSMLRKNPNALLGLLGMLILIAPFVHIVEAPYVIPTHCLYLASAMPIFFFIELSRIKFRPRVLYAALLGGAIITALFGLQSRFLARDWTNNVALSARNVRLFPRFYLAQRQMGVWLYYAGDYAESQKHLSRALELRPSDAKSLLYLGMTKLKLGDLKGAESTLEKCIDDKTFREEALRYLGKCHAPQVHQ